MLHNKRDLGFHESEYKVLMHLNEYYRLCVEVEECGGYLIEGDVFLLFQNKGLTRKVFKTDNILRDCRAELNFDTYLRVEKFFMEKST